MGRNDLEYFTEVLQKFKDVKFSDEKATPDPRQQPLPCLTLSGSGLKPDQIFQ